MGLRKIYSTVNDCCAQNSRKMASGACAIAGLYSGAQTVHNINNPDSIIYGAFALIFTIGSVVYASD